MFAHYLELGFRHLRRNPVLTGLMIVTLAVGVAASMATLTVLRAMSGDPIPHKSDRLFVPRLDVRPDDGTDPDPEPPMQLSYRDAVALHDARRGVRQTVLYGIAPAIDPGRADFPPFFANGIAVHADFFPMFDVPFVEGGAWSAVDDSRGGNVIVVRQSLAGRLFGDLDPIGRSVRLRDRDYVVTGVVADTWDPLPRFYRQIGGQGAFTGIEDVFIPFTTAIAAEMGQNGSTSCFNDDDGDVPGFEGLKQSQCVWLQMWVELAAAGEAAAYRDFVAGYAAEQRRLGRFPRGANVRLHDVMGWLDANQVVSEDSRLQTYLAFGFLLVCLVNTVGLMLAKFTARRGEIGVRRALGARRLAVFQQHLVEAGVVGLAGSVVGLIFTYGFLWLIGRQSQQLALLAKMDWTMFGTTVALAVGASLVAGLLPTWRACQVTPALQLKSQ